MANEAYLIDAIYGIVTKLNGGKSPAYFQRNGEFFVASTQGFGVISLGLDPNQEEVRAAITNVKTHDNNESGLQQKVMFSEGEKERINPIRFLHDNTDYSIDDMVKSAKTLSKLPDDGKIRMIQHWSSYHSHKYSYAGDGEDVGLMWAMTMDQKKYFELFRKRESECKVVKCAIITPDIALSLPTEVEIGENTCHWEKYTKPIIHRFTDASILGPEPFDIYLYTNARAIRIGEVKDFGKMQENLAKRMEMALSAISGRLGELKQYVAQTNRTTGKAARTEAEARRQALEEAQEY
jgi:hypothetical protein